MSIVLDRITMKSDQNFVLSIIVFIFADLYVGDGLWLYSCIGIV